MGPDATPATDDGAARADDVVDYWLGDAVRGPEAAERRRAVWYAGGPDVDAGIARRFGAAVEHALAGGFAGWASSARGALALVILLDQFTRNIHRGTPRAYAGDARAYAVTCGALDAGLDRALPFIGRIFLVHPLHHSESLADQDRVVALLRAMQAEHGPSWHAYFERRIAGFTRHRDIVARFGRFPHRNATLGRESTAAEIAFLAAGADAFGQGAPAAR